MLAALLLLAATPPPAVLEPRERFFYYDPDGRGAHAFLTPVSIIIEGGFSAFGDRSLHEFDFAGGAERLFGSIADPIGAIELRGWGRFFLSEFLPNGDPATGQWVPNWTWHLIGGGFRTRWLKEYFIHHGAAHPTLYAWLVAYTSHLVNELVQAERYHPLAVDAISDLFFFDWVGKLIFELDAVNEVATGTFHLTDWTTQTQWNPVDNSLINIGQLYWVRLHLWGPFSVSALTGELTNTVNLTFGVGGEEQLSLGLGFKPHDIVLNGKGDPVADSLHFTFGLYYSVADNPVMVATFESNVAFARAEDVAASEIHLTKGETFVLNLYPGWFSFGDFEPGLTLMVRGDAVLLGLSHGAIPFGIALDSRIRLPPSER